MFAFILFAVILPVIIDPEEILVEFNVAVVSPCTITLPDV